MTMNHVFRDRACQALGWLPILAVAVATACSDSNSDDASSEPNRYASLDVATDAGVDVTTAKVWTGDFSGLWNNNWGHGDFLISASGPQSHLGTKLWYGTFNGLLEGPFHRTDLTPSTTDAAVADFVRAKFDDVMIVTPSGAELLAGATGGTFMTGVWTSTSYSSSTHAWFGRR